MHVKDVMTSPVHVVEPATSVVAAAGKMRDANVGSLPVGEAGQLLGMITDRDIVVRCVADGHDCHKRTVREVMSAELMVCSDDQPVEEARQLMHEYQIRRLPVLDHKQRLVGILSLDHVGSVRMLSFGVWAALMGGVMGMLALVTGGLTAPMVAHGLYDILALEYIRRGAHPE
jgi:CBS domain-containing protein